MDTPHGFLWRPKVDVAMVFFVQSRATKHMALANIRSIVPWLTTKAVANAERESLKYC